MKHKRLKLGNLIIFLILLKPYFSFGLTDSVIKTEILWTCKHQINKKCSEINDFNIPAECAQAVSVENCLSDEKSIVRSEMKNFLIKEKLENKYKNLVGYIGVENYKSCAGSKDLSSCVKEKVNIQSKRSDPSSYINIKKINSLISNISKWEVYKNKYKFEYHYDPSVTPPRRKPDRKSRIISNYFSRRKKGINLTCEEQMCINLSCSEKMCIYLTQAEQMCINILLDQNRVFQKKDQSEKKQFKKCENMCIEEFRNRSKHRSPGEFCQMVSDSPEFKKHGTQISKPALKEEEWENLNRIYKGCEKEMYHVHGFIPNTRCGFKEKLKKRNKLLFNTSFYTLKKSMEDIKNFVANRSELSPEELSKYDFDASDPMRDWVDKIYRSTAISETINNHCQKFGSVPGLESLIANKCSKFPEVLNYFKKPKNCKKNKENTKIKDNGLKIADKIAKKANELLSFIKSTTININLTKRPPGLAVIRIGEDPASGVYVKNKERACSRVGIKSFIFHLKDTVEQKEVEQLITKLNLIQLTLAIILLIILVYFFSSLFISLPYYFSNYQITFIDSFFESFSGMTSTGFSISC